ncbi:glutamate receptor ionotropic, kainate 1-like [Stegodyphus dumicola]|uniref:glutamate receptor ionotropic, kainate 1-like n=1 Tax=Stegodyphus dumicola TaxID=202533 RepID=UPI0015AD87C4|nr:glutamate receptor ionotropic, kainate 1-like [Stegodyphus dumicola]
MINTDEARLPGRKLQARVKHIAPQDSFRALKTACSFLGEGMVAIVGPKSPSNMGVLQSTCDAFEMPLLLTHWALRTQARRYTINLFPESRILAGALTESLVHQNWKTFTLIFEDNEALIRLQEILQLPTKTEAEVQQHHMKVMLRHIKPDQDFKKLMKDLSNSRENNFVVDLPLSRVHQLFHDASQVQMMTEYQNYFLTSLDAHTVDWNTTIIGRTNITAFRLINPENEHFKKFLREWIFSEQTIGKDVPSKQPITTEAALVYDAVTMLAKSLRELERTRQLDLRSMYCDESAVSSHGNATIYHMQMHPFEGASGYIKIDKQGRRTAFSIDMVKITNKGIMKQTFFTTADEESETSVIVSYMIAEKIAKPGKPFAYGEFAKEYLHSVVDVLCPSQAQIISNINLSGVTVARRIEDVATYIFSKLKSKGKQFEFYSVAMDESIDVTDTAQVAIFIHGVDRDNCRGICQYRCT